MRYLVDLGIAVAIVIFVPIGFAVGDAVFGNARWYVSAATILLLGRLAIGVWEQF